MKHIGRKRRLRLDTCSTLSPLPQLPQLPTTRKMNNSLVPSNKSLNIIIDKLSRLMDPSVVSPRKRILREFERVSLEDLASKRRATPVLPIAVSRFEQYLSLFMVLNYFFMFYY